MVLVREREVSVLRPKAEGDRRARKELDRLLDFADDLRDFSKRIKSIRISCPAFKALFRGQLPGELRKAGQHLIFFPQGTFNGAEGKGGLSL